MSFDKMVTFGTSVKKVSGTTGCNNGLSDNSPNKRKQCFCETILTPYVQGSEADTNKVHHCAGDVYYVSKAVNTLKGALAHGHAKLLKNKAMAGYKCNNTTFGDPVPNQHKQCWCDAHP